MHVRALIKSRPADWLEHLETEYKIKVTRDGDLVSLKYNQIESPMSEPIVCECRGMVVDTSTTPNRILAHPYNKFWSLTDARADKIDWSTARVQEKLDGSLIQLFYRPGAWGERDGEWMVSSSGHPTAGGSFGDSTTETFRQAFWRMFAERKMLHPHGHEGITFMFELCAQENRIVVRHDVPRLVLHGARDASSKEASREDLVGFSETLGWEIVQEYPITSAEECLAAVELLDPIASEGFVVVDAQHNRVKVKSPRYVILHHMKGDFTHRRAIELWQTGESEELLAHFPEMAPQILPVHKKLDDIAQRAADGILASVGAPTRKDFAMIVKDQPWASVAFKMYGKSAVLEDVRAAMRDQSIAVLETMLEKMS